MKRLWMLVGGAVVAGAMYVAAAPGSGQATGPTARQFAALKKQVALLNKKLTALTKDEKVVKTAAGAAVGYIGACFLDTNGNIQNLPVTQFGTTSSGFLFGAPARGGTATTPACRRVRGTAACRPWHRASRRRRRFARPTGCSRRRACLGTRCRPTVRGGSG